MVKKWAVSCEKLFQKGKRKIIFLRQCFFMNKKKHDILRMRKQHLTFARKKRQHALNRKEYYEENSK